MCNPETVLENETQTFLGFLDTNGSLNLGQTTRPSDSQQKNRTCQIMEFGVLADHRIELKESKKGVEYLDLARELERLLNTKMTVIPILCGALEAISKWFGLVLWHINLCRLFNAKSIFM